jgi:hypothetical protein
MSRHVIVKPLVLAGVVGACAFAVPTASALQGVATPDPSADAKDPAVNPSFQSYRTPTIVEVASPTPAPSSAFDGRRRDWGVERSPSSPSPWGARCSSSAAARRALVSHPRPTRRRPEPPPAPSARRGGADGCLEGS